jgi:predicted TIM-barrel fold metal-dependent hydrolase
MAKQRVHDVMVNVHLGETEQPEWMQRVRKEYFKKGDEIYGSQDLQQLLDEMDANGVERCLLMSKVGDTQGKPYKFAQAHPDRFALGVGAGNLLTPMATLKALGDYIKDVPVAAINVGPAFQHDGIYAPDSSLYFPLYTKACEWEIPLCMNAGLPGPPIPGEAQNPIHYDRVMVRFPELKLCMMHGADPWWGTAIRLMIKYPNLHLATSAWSPKYLPQELLHYMRTRGKTKIIFASDWPLLTLTRTVTEAAALDLPDEVKDNYLYGNAQRFFFDRIAGKAVPPAKAAATA